MRLHVAIIMFGYISVVACSTSSCSSFTSCNNCTKDPGCSWCVLPSDQFGCSNSTTLCISPPVSRCDCLQVTAQDNCTACEDYGCSYCSEFYLGGPPICAANPSECAGSSIECKCLNAGNDCHQCQSVGCDFCGGTCVSAGRCYGPKVDNCDCVNPTNCSSCLAAGCEWCQSSSSGSSMCVDSVVSLFSCSSAPGALLSNAAICPVNACNFPNCSSCIANPSCVWCPSMSQCLPELFTDVYACPMALSSALECNCNQFTSCDSCTTNGTCRWCQTTGSCITSTRLPSTETLEFAISDPLDCFCANASLQTCHSCIAAGCQWDGSTNLCGKDGPIRTDFDCDRWANCTQHSSCSGCLSDPYCSYCGNLCTYPKCGSPVSECPIVIPGQGHCVNYSGCSDCLAHEDCVPALQLNAFNQYEYQCWATNATEIQVLFLAERCPKDVNATVDTCRYPECTMCIENGCFWSVTAGLCMPKSWSSSFPSGQFAFTFQQCCLFMAIGQSYYEHGNNIVVDELVVCALVLGAVVLWSILPRKYRKLAIFSNKLHHLKGASTFVPLFASALLALQAHYILRHLAVIGTFTLWNYLTNFWAMSLFFGSFVVFAMAVHSMLKSKQRKWLMFFHDKAGFLNFMTWSLIKAYCACLCLLGLAFPFDNLSWCLGLVVALIAICLCVEYTPKKSHLMRMCGSKPTLSSRILMLSETLRKPLLLVIPVFTALCTIKANNELALFSLSVLPSTTQCGMKEYIFNRRCLLSYEPVYLWEACLGVSTIQVAILAILGIQLRYVCKTCVVSLDESANGMRLCPLLGHDDEPRDSLSSNVTPSKFLNNFSTGALLPIISWLCFFVPLILLATYIALGEYFKASGPWITALFSFVCIVSVIELMMMGSYLANVVSWSPLVQQVITMVDTAAIVPPFPLIQPLWDRIWQIRSWKGQHSAVMINFFANGVFFLYRTVKMRDSHTFLASLAACMLGFVGVAVSGWSLFAHKHQLALIDVKYRIVMVLKSVLLVIKCFLVGLANDAASVDNLILFFLFAASILVSSFISFLQIHNIWQQREEVLQGIPWKKLFYVGRICLWLWVRGAIIFLVWATHFQPQMMLVPAALPFTMLATTIVFSSMLDHEIQTFVRHRVSYCRLDANSQKLCSDARPANSHSIQLTCILCFAISLESFWAEIALRIVMESEIPLLSYTSRNITQGIVNDQNIFMMISVLQFIVLIMLYFSVEIVSN